ncbi:MAG: ELWxxDGT repeat protein, partial [Pirellulaceae bacterium]
LTNVNGVLFFTANDGVHGTELWKSDGSIAGTVMVKDINPRASGSSPTYLTNFGGRLFFSASDGVNGHEVWRSNGAVGNTNMLLDIFPGIVGSSSNSFTEAGGLLYFEADDGVNGEELWVTDGRAAGTVLLKDTWPGPNGFVSNITNVKGIILFTASDGINGIEIWRSNGTTGGTFMLKDIRPGLFGSTPRNFTNVKGVLYFSANDGTSGYELWKSTGSAANTVLVKDIQPGLGSSNPSYLTNVKGVVYFAAADDPFFSGNELWKSNGSSTGTTLIKDIADGSYGFYSSDPHNLINANGTLMFAANNVVNGIEMWRSNGSATGTVLVKDLNPGVNGSYPMLPEKKSDQTLVNLNSTLFFVANNGSTGFELWRSGIFGNTMFSVGDIRPGLPSATIERMTGVGTKLFFVADDGINGLELWVLKNPPPPPSMILAPNEFPSDQNVAPAGLDEATVSQSSFWEKSHRWAMPLQRATDDATKNRIGKPSQITLPGSPSDPTYPNLPANSIDALGQLAAFANNAANQTPVVSPTSSTTTPRRREVADSGIDTERNQWHDLDHCFVELAETMPNLLED